MRAITKERLEEIRDFDTCVTLKESAEMARQLLASMEQEPVAWTAGGYSQNVGCNFGEKLPGEAPSIAAVYWDRNTFKHDTDCQETSDRWLAEAIKNTGAKPLYAAPQLPQPAVMDDEQSKRLFDKWSGGDAALGELRSNGVPDEFISMLKGFSMASWEACRAAMLQGAEPDFREISNSSTKYFRGNAETSTKLRHPSPIDHGYRSDCECSGCMATARIYAELAVRSPVIPDCWCRTCRPLTVADMRFVVCPECGNKRCPRANDHRNACTGSNEPGQDGSAYPALQQEARKSNVIGTYQGADLKEHPIVNLCTTREEPEFKVTSDHRRMEMPNE